MAYVQKQQPVHRTVAIVLELAYKARIIDDYIGIRREGDVTISLPEGKIGKTLVIKNELASVPGTYKIVPFTGQTIDLASEYILSEPFESITIIFSPETNWCII